MSLHPGLGMTAPTGWLLVSPTCSAQRAVAEADALRAARLAHEEALRAAAEARGGAAAAALGGGGVHDPGSSGTDWQHSLAQGLCCFTHADAGKAVQHLEGTEPSPGTSSCSLLMCSTARENAV